MDYEFRVIVEKVSVAGQKVVKRDTVATYGMNPPESILDLGLRHEAQIALLAKVQDALLAGLRCKKIQRGEEPCGSNLYYAVTPKILLMNEICPKTSPLSTSLICPLRIMFIAS